MQLSAEAYWVPVTAREHFVPPCTHTHVHTRTHLTSRSVMVVVYTICEPSRLKWACFFSLITKARSLGAWPSIWWPSLGKVILVPSFHPFFTSTSNTRSSGLNVFCPSAGGVSVSHASSRPLKCPPVTRGARELRPRSMAWARPCFRDAGWGGAGGFAGRG